MTLALLLFLSLITLAWVLIALSPAHASTFQNQLTSDEAPPDDFPPPPVALVIPARNEGAMLPGTAPSWCTQDYPGLRVVVVDDQSEDDTAAVLAAFAATYPNLTVVSAGPRPPGWLGKPWAVSRGVEQAPPADWLLFSDADCAFHPRAVRIAVAYAQRENLDMLSLLPRLLCGSVAERVGMTAFVSALSLIFPLGWVNDPARTGSALASGGFILIRRPVYDAVGGHAAVRSEMIEDQKLAARVKSSGARMRILLTGDLVTTRMYEGLADMWEGLTKNAYAGMAYRPVTFLASLAAGFFGGVLAPLYLLAATAWAALDPSSAAAKLAAGLTLTLTATMAVLYRRSVRFLRLPWYYALTFPLGGGFLLAVGLSSLWQNHFGGGNVWKGRRYDRKTLLAAAAADPDSD